MTTQTASRGMPSGLSGSALRILAQFWPWLFLLAMFIFFSLTGPGFFSVRTVGVILVTSTLVLLMAIGQTFVIITGGIDLSIGWTVGLASIIAARTMRDLGNGGTDPVVAILMGSVLGILVGLIPGLVNGILVAKIKVPPFIATLGMFGIVRGAAFLLTDGQNVVGNLPQNVRESLISFGNGSLIYYLPDSGISFFTQPELVGQQARTLQRLLPYPVLVVAFVLVIAAFFLARSTFGRHTYAIGGNAEASRRAGINVDRHLIYIYVLAAFMAGIAGILHVTRFTAGSPNAGEAALLDSVAAVVIGGTSLFGGEGRLSGTLVGALIIGVLQTGLVILNVVPLWQFIIVGVIIIIAVLVNQAQNSIATRAERR